MRHAKKVAGFVFMLILVISLAACGGNNGGNNAGGNANVADGADNGGGSSDGGNKQGDGNDGAADGGIDTSKFETITYVVLGDKPKNGQLETVMEKVNAILKQKINAELQFKWVEWADWQNKTTCCSHPASRST